LSTVSSKKTVLVTGACGMVGSHLAEYYYNKGVGVIGTKWTKPTIDIEDIADRIDLIECDVRNADHVQEIIETYKPELIYHLAAQSFPTVSWLKPAETMDINANGTINVFEAILHVRKSLPHYDPMVVVACSSAQYGSSLTPENTPIKEDVIFLPLHPYGVSKVAQDLLSYQYFVNNKIRSIRARIFNTTGVRKIQDVVSEFTRRAVQLEKGLITEFTVGNLKSQRAIADVRDLIDALVLLAEKGKAGDAYNISGNKVYEISEVITHIENYLNIKIPYRVDSSLLRSTDEPVIYGDSAKMIADTGWCQTIPLEKTIQDMIDYWRTKL
jgi:GDP-4-dehydro-6-deoxy-D-mannose reductase